MKTVGFLGPKGTFSDLACQHYCKTSAKLDGVPYPSIDHLFQALEDGTVQSIVVPAENSIEGPVNLSVDRLLHLPEQYFITAEIVLPISQYLLSKDHTSLDFITDIYSHEQPLAQCQLFLKKNCPQAVTHSVSSTAKAAESMSNSTLPFLDKQRHIPAVIGQKQLAELYDLHLVTPNPINDVEGNCTRFYVISDDVTYVETAGFTAIVVGGKKDQPGSLYDILGEFASRNINLTRILSRPTKKELGEYLFYIECEGLHLNPVVASALAGVKTKAGFYRWLGSYPKGGHDA